MNAEEVITAHLEWKDRLQQAMAANEAVDAAEASSDGRCKFGKWLYSEARERFGKWPEYAQCVARHAAFHREAGKVALLINDGDQQAAERALSAGSYVNASAALGFAVRAMFARGASA